MFFDDSGLVLEIFGVFKIKRGVYSKEAACGRSYDALSIRLYGQCDFRTNDNEFTVTQNDLLYIPNNVLYSQNTDGEEIIAVHFINYNRKDRTDMEIFSVDDSEFFKAEFEKMYEIWNEKKTGYRRLCTSVLYNVLYRTAQKHDEQSYLSKETDELMDKAINFIHQNYKKEKISISELSKSLFVSETYFRRIFKRNYGVAPNDYIISLKLEYASQMLASGHYSVKEASENAGFLDTKYFSRVFKKRFSVTPSEYKKAFNKSHACGCNTANLRLSVLE